MIHRLERESDTRAGPQAASGGLGVVSRLDNWKMTPTRGTGWFQPIPCVPAVTLSNPSSATRRRARKFLVRVIVDQGTGDRLFGDNYDILLDLLQEENTPLDELYWPL
jgi:hypothetical protein